MADARSLLRAQRAARRIDHPHAQYTDAGKLTCVVCREGVKSESLWEGHIRGAGHRQRLLAQQKAKANHGGGGTGGNTGQRSKPNTDTLSDEALLAQIIGGAGQKRKHAEDSDVEMADAAGEAEEEEEEGVRKKRWRQDIGSPPTTTTTTTNTNTTNSAGMPSLSPPTAQGDSPGEKDKDVTRKTTPTATPPVMPRRISGTPSHGVELQIPSRPATPSAGAASATSTPKATPLGKSPLMPQEGQMGMLPGGVTSKQGPRAAFATAMDITPTATTQTNITSNATITTTGTADAEDDDWAAFEAEVVHAPQPAANTIATTTPGYSGDVVISAAPLTAEQLAAKSEEEERAKRRAVADIELEDEKEEATRALETEFEEMEELEARVRKLKEKREAIRRGSVPALAHAPPPPVEAVNGDQQGKEEEDGDEDDDEEDEDFDDDWASFRFRG